MLDLMKRMYSAVLWFSSDITVLGESFKVLPCSERESCLQAIIDTPPRRSCSQSLKSSGATEQYVSISFMSKPRYIRHSAIEETVNKYRCLSPETRPSSNDSSNTSKCPEIGENRCAAKWIKRVSPLPTVEGSWHCLSSWRLASYICRLKDGSSANRLAPIIEKYA